MTKAKRRFRKPATGRPAIFLPIESKPLNKAYDWFRAGKDKLCFVTDGPIGRAWHLKIRNVYFKRKGQNWISARAKFIRLTDKNPTTIRLPGHSHEIGKFLYIFRNLKKIDPIPLSTLQYYKRHTKLRNDARGACIINEPGAP